MTNKYLEKIAEGLLQKPNESTSFLKKVVIIKGNPKYLNKEKRKSKTFYGEVESILKDRGIKVEFDPGLPYTVPDESAYAWVGHSRGVDRLRFAPRDVKTVTLRTLSDDGGSTNHYILSDEDKKALQSL